MSKELNNLKSIIEDKGLRQEWIAKKVGVAPSVMSLWVNNKRQPNGLHLVKLAKAIKCKAREIYDR
jgi:transcriptional regulator with XRE-family HTH domain